MLVKEMSVLQGGCAGRVHIQGTFSIVRVVTRGVPAAAASRTGTMLLGVFDETVLLVVCSGRCWGVAVAKIARGPRHHPRAAVMSCVVLWDP